MITIALDAMGGDYGASVVVPAALKALAQHDNLHLILVGDQATLERRLSKGKIKSHPRLSIHHASQVVAMDELPSQALRLKKDSSMRVAINLVKQGEAQACVSAGNTGALMATARFVLKTLPGIDRPAIVGLLPSTNKYGYVRVLDLGANVDSHAEHLFQFAVMGSVLASAVDNIPHPRVALLNIGEEAIKGNEQVKETALLLAKTSAINYAGFVEGDDIFKNAADVIVCDGFVGNVALKTSEGAARFISQALQRTFRRNWLTKIAGLLVKPVIAPLRKELDPALYNGASLLGLKGIVIKSHGGTSTLGFAQAINRAISEVEHNVPHLISTQVLQLLEQSYNV